jgi:hypothetical protein
VTNEIPPDTGSADPSSELRDAANTVRERFRKGSPSYGFWRVIAGIWDRWAERMELGIELSPVSNAEFQAALFSARKYLEMRHGGSAPIVCSGTVTCDKCGHVFTEKGEPGLTGTELSARLLGHVCQDDQRHSSGSSS